MDLVRSRCHHGMGTAYCTLACNCVDWAVDSLDVVHNDVCSVGAVSVPCYLRYEIRCYVHYDHLNHCL